MSAETRVAALQAAIADCRSESVAIMRLRRALTDQERERLDELDQQRADLTEELDVLTDETVVR